MTLERPLHIQDDDTVEKVPGSEFVVGRVAHRSNTSDYMIDGSKKPAKVVVERLKREGIDLNHNRFLILQVWRPHSEVSCTMQSSRLQDAAVASGASCCRVSMESSQTMSDQQSIHQWLPCIRRARWSRSA